MLTHFEIYAVLSPGLGAYVDSVYNASGGANNGGDVHSAIYNVAGAQFTVLCVVVLLSTFIPKVSCSASSKHSALLMSSSGCYQPQPAGPIR